MSMSVSFTPTPSVQPAPAPRAVPRDDDDRAAQAKKGDETREAQSREVARSDASGKSDRTTGRYLDITV